MAKSYEQHPLAISLLPSDTDDSEEFNAFCEDVEAKGLVESITIYEGKVLDGWRRYRACERTGTAIKTREYTGDDPAGYLASQNIHRRKLSSLQRALFGARMHLDHEVTTRNVCKRFGISNTVLSMVIKTINSRNTMLIKRIETDAEFTRGMLREELASQGTVHENYGRSADASNIVFQPKSNSVFAAAATLGAAATQLPAGALPPETDDDGNEDDESEGGIPDIGKRPSKPERKAKASAAQLLQEQFRELMVDEKRTFLQMIWPEARALAEDMKLPGLGSKAPAKAKLKKVA